MNFLIVFLVATSGIFVVTGVIINLLRNRYVAGPAKAPTDRKERIISNYSKQIKLFNIVLWSLPVYIVIMYLVYEYVPEVSREVLIEAAIIIILFFTGLLLNLSFKKFILKALKTN